MAMMAKIAWRNLWRHRRRTAITLSSFALGIMLAVLFTGVADATYAKMIDFAARVGGGHISLRHADALASPSLKETVQGTSALRRAALEQPGVRAAVPRVAGAAMVAAAGKSYGVMLYGIDPRLETAETFALHQAIERGEGQMFAPDDRRGIVLGKTLAQNLGVVVGHKVVYTMTDRHGEVVSGLGRVRGVFATGTDSMDAGVAVMPIGTAREVLGYGPQEATEVAVFLDDPRRVDDVLPTLARLVTPPTTAFPWYKVNPDLAGFIAVDSGGLVFFEGLILVLIGAGVFNALLVSVMERTRELGIMIALGFTPGQIFRLVVWESLWLSLLGLVVGALVTVGPYAYMHTQGVDMSGMVGSEGMDVSGVIMDTWMYATIAPEKLLLIVTVVVLSTLAAGLYPAWKAGRVEPTASIKLV